MANQFVNLPALAANGAGAWIDMSSFGGLKTITVEPNGDVFSPFVTIECSNQDTPTVGYPLTTFQQVKDQTFDVACHWMRAVTANYKGGGAPTVAVGGTDDGTSSAQLPVPVGDGLGTAVDVSALENLKTVQVAGVFGGTVNVLVSEDGGATYNNAFSFQGGTGTAFQTLIIVADFMRIQRVGVPLVAPGQPVAWISATAGGGGGGGAGGVDVQEDGVDVVNPATILNFTGAGVTVTDGGSGIAIINIRGPGQVQLINDAGAPMIIGTPVYSDAPGGMNNAIADGTGKARVIGLVADASVDAGTLGFVAVNGVFVATMAQWDAICGTSGGLAFDTPYYLSPTTPGRLTATAPVAPGQEVTQVIVGLSATEARIAITAPIPLTV